VEITEKEALNRITNVYIEVLKLSKKAKIGDSREFFKAIDLYYTLLFWSFNENRELLPEASKYFMLSGILEDLKKIKRRQFDFKEEQSSGELAK